MYCAYVLRITFEAKLKGESKSLSISLQEREKFEEVKEMSTRGRRNGVRKV